MSSVEIISAAEVEEVLATIRMPALDIFGGDWLKDAVAGCSLAANGLWFRICLVMHDAKPYGHLVGANGKPFSEKQIAKQTGCDGTAELKRVLSELTEVGVPGITGDEQYDRLFEASFAGAVIDLSPMRIADGGVLYSRRMIRDQRLRVIRRIAGRRGWDARMLKIAARSSAEAAPDKPLTQQQEYVKLVLDAVSEALRPSFHPGRVAAWIKTLGSAEAVVALIQKYPTKPADYIEKCVHTASHEGNDGHRNTSRNGGKPSGGTGRKRTAADYGNEIWTPGSASGHGKVS